MKKWDDSSGISGISGLPEAEGDRKLEEEGYNELPSTKKRSILAIAHEVVREPMFLHLVVGGGVRFFGN